MNNIHAQQETTLKELIVSLSPYFASGKTPTPKALRLRAGDPVAEIPGLLVYRNGYAVYENASGRSVFHITDCLSFTFVFQPARPGENSPVPDTFTVPQKAMEDLPWYIPLTLVGDYRVEYNDRVHQREYSLDTEDPGMLDNLFNQETDPFPAVGFGIGCGENPEAALIRRENNREMLETLTGRQRQVFELYYFEGYNQLEIAKMLNLGRPAVTRLLSRALERVRGLL